MAIPIVGILDSNIVIHSFTNDQWTEPAIALLTQIEQGELLVTIDPMVIHEIAYALPRYAK